MKIEFEADQLIREIIKGVVKELKPIEKTEAGDILFDVSGLCEYLSTKDSKIKPAWVYKKIQMGEVPYLRLGKFLRFKKSVIDRWLDRNSIDQTNPLSSKVLKVVK